MTPVTFISSDVMCLPSHREPFGLVYIEAALAEKPVIACDAGGVPEIITIRKPVCSSRRKTPPRSPTRFSRSSITAPRRKRSAVGREKRPSSGSDGAII
jgi:hypothetical protein